MLKCIQAQKINMSEDAKTVEGTITQYPEKSLPPNSDFLHHRLNAGDKYFIGFTMFEDYYLTYSNQDQKIMADLWHHTLTEPSLYQVYANQLYDSSLTEGEILFIAQVAATIRSFNGGQIGEGIANEEQLKALSKKRLQTYKDTDLDRTVTLSNIQGQGIVACAEASLMAQALSQYAKGYHIVSADVVSRADTESAAGHGFNFLINDEESRIIVFDIAYGVVREIDGARILVPYVALLTVGQIERFENGQNVTIESMGERRVYRIGTPFTPEGNWKDNYLTLKSMTGN